MTNIKSAFLTILMMGIVSVGWSQDAQEKEKQSVPTASQVLSGHYMKTYQMAMRYNDFNIAKNALYDLYVENPQNDSILYSLSTLYLQSGQYTSAALSAQDIIRMRPAHTGAMEILAVSYEELGIKDKALDTFESLYLKTDDYQTLYRIAFLQFDLGRLNESNTNVDILIGKKQSEELTVKYEIGNNQQKDYPIKVALYNLKGLIAKEKGDKIAAKKYFEEALKIAPDFALAKENITNLSK